MANCVIKSGHGEATTRGLCANCYQSARVLVNNKKTSWEVLESHGLAKPSRRGGKNDFGEAFAKAMNGK